MMSRLWFYCVGIGATSMVFCGVPCLNPMGVGLRQLTFVCMGGIQQCLWSLLCGVGRALVNFFAMAPTVSPPCCIGCVVVLWYGIGVRVGGKAFCSRDWIPFSRSCWFFGCSH